MTDKIKKVLSHVMNVFKKHLLENTFYGEKNNLKKLVKEKDLQNKPVEINLKKIITFLKKFIKG